MKKYKTSGPCSQLTSTEKITKSADIHEPEYIFFILLCSKNKKNEISILSLCALLICIVILFD